MLTLETAAKIRKNAIDELKVSIDYLEININRSYGMERIRLERRLQEELMMLNIYEGTDPEDWE
jgi:hypothetical protein